MRRSQGNTPSWSRAQIQVNAKRKGSAFLWGAINRKGGPSLATADVALSFDRAFAELKGVEPVHIARSFYKNLARRAADLNRWPIRNHFTSTVEENTARIKRERTVLLQSRYEHPLKAALSPLVWSAEKGRPIANSLFTGPLRQQRELASNAIEKAATGPGLHE